MTDAVEKHLLTIETSVSFEDVLHIRSLLESIMICRQVREETQNNIKLAFTEAVNNIILHSYKGNPGYLRVEITVRPDNWLHLVLVDRGVPLRDDYVAPQEVDDYSESGRGLKLIHGLIDRVGFDWTGEENHLILDACLDRAPADAGAEPKTEEPGVEIIEYFNVIRYIGREEDMFSDFFDRLENRLKADVYFIHDSRQNIIHVHVTGNHSLEQIEALERLVLTGGNAAENMIVLTRQTKKLLHASAGEIRIVDAIEVPLDNGVMVLLKLAESDHPAAGEPIADIDYLSGLGIEFKPQPVALPFARPEPASPARPEPPRKKKEMKFFDHDRQYITRLRPFIDTLMKISRLHYQLVDYHYELSAKLSIFHDLADAFHYFRDIDQARIRILEIGKRVFGAEVGYLLTTDGAGRTNAQMGLDINIGTYLRDAADRPLRQALADSTTTLFYDRAAIPGMNQFNLENLVCANIFSRDCRLGEMIIGNAEPDLFTNELTRLAYEIFLYLAGAVIDNARLYQESLRQQMLEQEMRLAQQIQKQLMPLTHPVVPGIELGCLAVPARNLGGDYFDIIEWDEHRLGLVIADVSGKGVGPALLMATVRGYLRGLCRQYPAPGELLGCLNNILCGEIADDRFITLALALLDRRTGAMEITVAGHLPALIIRTDATVEEFPAGALPLGIMPNQQFTAQPTVLRPGDILGLFTDGIIECFGQDRVEPGLEAFRRLLIQWRAAAPAEIVKRIQTRLTDLGGGASPHDDQTLLIIRRPVPPGGLPEP